MSKKCDVKTYPLYSFDGKGAFHPGSALISSASFAPKATAHTMLVASTAYSVSRIMPKESALCGCLITRFLYGSEISDHVQYDFVMVTFFYKNTRTKCGSDRTHLIDRGANARLFVFKKSKYIILVKQTSRFIIIPSGPPRNDEKNKTLMELVMRHYIRLPSIRIFKYGIVMLGSSRAFLVIWKIYCIWLKLVCVAENDTLRANLDINSNNTDDMSNTIVVYFVLVGRTTFFWWAYTPKSVFDEGEDRSVPCRTFYILLQNTWKRWWGRDGLLNTKDTMDHDDARWLVTCVHTLWFFVFFSVKYYKMWSVIK